MSLPPTRTVLDDVVLRWPTAFARNWLEEFLDNIERDSNILAVIMVGSAVRTSVSSEDLDVVVLSQRPYEFNYRAPIEVDLRSFAVDEVEALLAERHELLGWAVMYGHAVFQRQKIWTTLVTKWRGRVPLPDSQRARKRAQQALMRVVELEDLGDKAAAAELRLSYVTLLARATLADAGVYPKSRPELPAQLQSMGEKDLAERLIEIIEERSRLSTRVRDYSGRVQTG